MMRYFTQVHPTIISKGSYTMRNPECLAIVKGNLVPCRVATRKFSEKYDKNHPGQQGQTGKEEKESKTLPGFVSPHKTFSEEGVLTQKEIQQIEEQKKKKVNPTLHNPEGRE